MHHNVGKWRQAGASACTGGAARRRGALRRACLAAAVFAVCGQLAAQDMLAGLFERPVREAALRVEARGAAFARAETGPDAAALDFASCGVALRYRRPLARDFELQLAGAADRYRIRTDARLPGSAVRVPERIWDLALTGGVKHYTASGHSRGVYASVSSPSDRPFGSADEIVLGATAFAVFPAGTRDTWALFLNYGNRRSFLNHVPLPGAAYVWMPRRGTLVMLGLPATVARVTFGHGWEADGFFFPPLRGRLGLAYAVTPAVKPYVRVVNELDTFLRSGRADNDAWLRHDVFHADAGVEVRLSAALALNASIGYVMTRRLYEAESYSTGDAALEAAPGVMAAVSLSAAL